MLLAGMATVLVAAVVATQVFLVVYLLILTTLAFSFRHPKVLGGAGRTRFAVLIPAHNEEAVLARLLESLQQLEYPQAQFDVCVVADNCDDSTPSIARSFGVRVFERFDSVDRAKGYALRWLLEQLEGDRGRYDAFVIVDADSVVAPNFLRVMDARLSRGAKAVQAYYTVLNHHASPVAGLRYVALAALHYLRPLGRSAVGLSAGLKGHGMCFSAAIIDQFAWRWFTLAEDVEFHLALVEHGIRVEFAHETWVKGDMPVTLRQAQSQNERWERGRLQLVKRHVPKLIWHGVRQRRWLQIDAAIEQLTPPLSVPVAIALVATPAAYHLDSPVLAAVAAACLAGYGLYLFAALVLVRAPLRIYLSLISAPAYIGWKLGLYGQSLLSPQSTAWVRTARRPSAR